METLTYRHTPWTWHAKHITWSVLTGLMWLPFYLIKWRNRKRPIMRTVTR